MGKTNTSKRKPYYFTIDRNSSTEYEVCIMSPGGKCMALRWFCTDWDRKHVRQAKADATLIVQALNAYTRRGPEGATTR